MCNCKWFFRVGCFEQPNNLFLHLDLAPFLLVTKTEQQQLVLEQWNCLRCNWFPLRNHCLGHFGWNVDADQGHDNWEGAYLVVFICLSTLTCETALIVLGLNCNFWEVVSVRWFPESIDSYGNATRYESFQFSFGARGTFCSKWHIFLEYYGSRCDHSYDLNHPKATNRIVFYIFLHNLAGLLGPKVWRSESCNIKPLENLSDVPRPPLDILLRRESMNMLMLGAQMWAATMWRTQTWLHVANFLVTGSTYFRNMISIICWSSWCIMCINMYQPSIMWANDIIFCLNGTVRRSPHFLALVVRQNIVNKNIRECSNGYTL